MYLIAGILVMIFVGMIVAGLFGRIGSESIGEIDANIAATIALMVTYAFFLMSVSSTAELATIFEAICGGIPFVNEITDYGSLTNVFHAAPLKAATAFLDVVFLTTIINIVSLLPLTSGNATGKLMVKLFTSIVVALVSLVILNYIVKETGAYQYLVALLGALIAFISIGSIPFTIISLINNNLTFGVGFFSLLLLFSKSKIVGILRDSLLKAIVYVVGIYELEKNFGTVANSMSQLTKFVIAFAPVFIMILGLVIMLKSIFTK